MPWLLCTVFRGSETDGQGHQSLGGPGGGMGSCTEPLPHQAQPWGTANSAAVGHLLSGLGHWGHFGICHCPELKAKTISLRGSLGQACLLAWLTQGSNNPAWGTWKPAATHARVHTHTHTERNSASMNLSRILQLKNPPKEVVSISACL